LKGSIIDAVNWKPFDIRYDALLRRWEKHTECMEIEMRLSTNVDHMNNSDQLEDMLVELEKLRAFQDRQTTELRSGELGSFQTESLKSRPTCLRFIDQRVHRIKQWINAPTWSDTLDSARSRRSCNTTDWLFENSTVQDWLQWGLTDQMSESFKLLTVEGGCLRFIP
jgi:hypothetical protein